MARRFPSKLIQTSLFLTGVFGAFYFTIDQGYDYSRQLALEKVNYETSFPWFSASKKYEIEENISGNKILYDLKSPIKYQDLVNESNKNYRLSEVVYFGDTFNFNGFVPKNDLKESLEERANFLINVKTEHDKHTNLDSFVKSNIKSLKKVKEEVEKLEKSSFL